MAGEEETVTVIRVGPRDPFGDPAAGGPPEFPLPGCLFAPGKSADGDVGSAGTDTDATIYGPPGADVRPTDRIRARGQVYVVVGEPQDWGSAGTVIVLRKAA